MIQEPPQLSPTVHASNEIYTEALHTEEQFDGLRRAWDELLDDSNQRVYFLRWSWNRLWWKAYAPREGQLYLITCYDNTQKLVGIAPLYWRRSSTPTLPSLNEVVFLGTGIPITTSEHLDLIARRGYEQQVADAVATVLKQDANVDRVFLNEIPITSITLPHLRRSLSGHQTLTRCNRYHYVDTRLSWEGFITTLGKSTRNKLKRCMRRLTKFKSWSFHCVKIVEELNPAMEGLIRLHQLRWRSKGEPGSFALKPFRRFLIEAMHSALSDGSLRLWSMTINGEMAAALVAFLDNGVAHYFQGGFDPKYKKDSLGMVMFGLCIRACIEDDEVHRFNFMGGDVAYKSHWTKLGLDSVALEWLRPGARSSLFRLYETSELAGKSVLRALVPKAILAARRRRITGS